MGSACVAATVLPWFQSLSRPCGRPKVKAFHKDLSVSTRGDEADCIKLKNSFKTMGLIIPGWVFFHTGVSMDAIDLYLSD